MSSYVRINSTSKKVISYSKLYVEKTLNYKFDFAISTRNYLLLDFDCGSNIEECIEEAIEISKVIVDELGGNVYIFKTNNGIHLIHDVFLPFSEIKTMLKAFKLLNTKYLDKKHIDACLRRGYLTLRLNQKKAILKVSKSGVEYYE